MSSIKDLSGKKFGRWTVLGFSYKKTLGKYHYQMWKCVCNCGTTKIVDGTSLKKGNSISCGCLTKESVPKGKDHYQWKEKGLGYWGIHQWLRKHYGKSDRCENKECSQKSKIYVWAKLKGQTYERKRENYWKLCASCHNVYDGMSKNLINSPTWSKLKK